MSEKERTANMAKLGLDSNQVLATLQQKADDALRLAAPSLQLDYDALQAAISRPEVAAAITDDIDSSKKLPSLRWGMPAGLHSIPTIFLNEKLVPRWQMGTDSVLAVILDAAAADVRK